MYILVSSKANTPLHPHYSLSLHRLYKRASDTTFRLVAVAQRSPLGLEVVFRKRWIYFNMVVSRIVFGVPSNVVTCLFL
jgi:hypothetical protein